MTSRDITSSRRLAVVHRLILSVDQAVSYRLIGLPSRSLRLCSFKAAGKLRMKSANTPLVIAVVRSDTKNRRELETRLWFGRRLKNLLCALQTAIRSCGVLALLIILTLVRHGLLVAFHWIVCCATVFVS